VVVGRVVLHFYVLVDVVLICRKVALFMWLSGHLVVCFEDGLVFWGWMWFGGLVLVGVL